MRHAPLLAVRPTIGALSLAVLLVASAISESAYAAPTVDAPAISSVGHLVVSEVVTGGAGASDEFVELYNPSPVPLPLDGLELVYVTASGATITRKAVWGPGAAVGPGGHVLVANEAGLFGSVADVTYANGLAAAGGSMAIRAIGAASAVDAVGWGTAASAWLEGAPATAAPAGSSLERLPGGELGSGQDSDHNLVDFVVRATPDPQNSASPPVPAETPTPEPSPSPSDSPSDIASPSATAEPSASPDPSVTPEPSATASPTHEPSVTPEPSSPPAPTVTPSPSSTPTPTPGPTPLTVAQARALSDDSPVLVRGTTLTDSTFAEGGGYLADASGGIAVLLEDGAFPRGVELVVSGTVDDRFAQRTVRADSAGLTILGPGTDLEPAAVDSGAVGERFEGQLITVSGIISGSPTTLAAGLAYEVDDGSGPIRVLVGPATGIDTTGWQAGATLTVTGVVGQRDSSGTGTDGYRVQPRDSGDVLALAPQATPEPTSSPSPSPSPSPSASPTPTAAPLVTIAAARASTVGTTIRIRGVVTLPTGLVEAGSAVVADPSGAILVRVGSEVGRLRRGELVEITGSRSTRTGMATLRVTQPAAVLGTQAEPVALRRATGRIGEADEALLVVVRGLVRDGPRRASGGGLTLTVNDGSGALRVLVASGTGIGARAIPAGSWVELRGVIGQQTTNAAPNAGYRLWPRDRADVMVVAPATGGGRGAGGSSGGGSTVRPTTTRTPATPAPSVLVTTPNLGGALVLAPSSEKPLTAARPGPPPVPPIQAPLAAGLGGLAGLLALAWRHGTWDRGWTEIRRRVAARRTAANDEVADESYTLAP